MQESASIAGASPIRAMRLSLEPRTASTSLSASPSLESLTPTHSSQNLCGENTNAAAIVAERHASPFFAGWERHPGLAGPQQQTAMPDSAMSAGRSSATQYHAPPELQSLHAQSVHHEHHPLRESASRRHLPCGASGGTCVSGPHLLTPFRMHLRSI